MNTIARIWGSKCTMLAALVSTFGVACGAQDGASEDVSASTHAVTIGSSADSPDYFECATEGGTCVAGDSAYIAFGDLATNRFVFRLGGGNVPCNVPTFGDPASGVVKKCYVANMTSVTPENLSGVEDGFVAFGVDGKFKFKEIHGSYTCNVATFGDPWFGKAKSCYRLLPSYRHEVGEGGTLTNLSNTPVAFGANGKFVYAVASGTKSCTVASFGSDPAVGVVKACYILAYDFLADEGGAYTLPHGDQYLTFYGSGLNGIFNLGVAQTAACSNLAQGGDTHPGVQKHCWGESFTIR